MKKVLYLIYILPILVHAQEFHMIDTLNFGNSVREVSLRNIHVKQNTNELVAVFIFNDQGYHVSSYWNYNHPSQIKSVYEYSGAKLISTKKLKYISAHNEILSSQYSNEMHIIHRKYRDDEEMKYVAWDSLKAKYELLYKYENPEYIRWEDSAFVVSKCDLKYNSSNQISKILSYVQLNKNEMYLDEIISFKYNEHGQVIQEQTKELPNENVFKFQAFNPSSTEQEDSIRTLSGNVKEKNYCYLTDTTVIEYLVNNKVTGYEYQLFNKNKSQIKYTLINREQDTLSIYVECFNNQKQKIKRTRIYDEGYSGFGYSLDLVYGNEKEYHYDSLGNLLEIVTLQDRQPVYIDKYEIKRRNLSLHNRD